MARAYATVPAPTVPPSSQPVVSTVSSIPVRTSRTERPVRRCSPVISPSRGPVPKRAAMYRPVAAPFSTIAKASSGTRTAMAPACGTTARVASIARPITTTFDTVPRPGRCRSGSQSSSTTAPVTIETVPMESPVRPATPWWKTSHGLVPRWARSMRAVLAPYRTRPA